MTQSEFLQRCISRGFYHQCTQKDVLDRHLASDTPVKAYIGFDCTASSLHVGSLIQIMLLRHLQQCGHQPIILLGGGTTKVGDPSGKDKSRQLLDDAAIARNKAGIKSVFEAFLCFGDDETDATIVDNADWLNHLNYVDFLRDIGRHFSVNRMLSMESVKQRLDRQQPLSFLEFNYMILQAYDFVELHQRYGCTLQIGGSDQWGNIVNGTELYRHLHPTASGDIRESALFGLTTPLLTTASGAKMGKTADGAVWLDEALFSAYDYWQFWRNCDDADVGRFLKLFTDLPLEEIARLEALEGSHINDAKKVLASEATTLLHGRQAAEKAATAAQAAFEGGNQMDAMPVTTLSVAEHGKDIAAFKLFQVSGLVASGAEARRLIKGGGAKIDGLKVGEEHQMVSLVAGEQHTLSAGKKKHLRIEVTQ